MAKNQSKFKCKANFKILKCGYIFCERPHKKIEYKVR